MEQEYRIPTIDEFVPGFEFQQCTQTLQWVMIDFGKPSSENNLEELGKPFQVWKDREFPDYDNNQTYTETSPDGVKWTWLRNPYVTFPKEKYLEQIEIALKEGRIRCKI